MRRCHFVLIRNFIMDFNDFRNKMRWEITLVMTKYEIFLKHEDIKFVIIIQKTITSLHIIQHSRCKMSSYFFHQNNIFSDLLFINIFQSSQSSYSKYSYCKKNWKKLWRYNCYSIINSSEIIFYVITSWPDKWWFVI